MASTPEPSIDLSLQPVEVEAATDIDVNPCGIGQSACRKRHDSFANIVGLTPPTHRHAA
jgi:hypothetical protein